MQDPSVDGIFVDCVDRGYYKKCTLSEVHTYFFAFRPKAVDPAVMTRPSAIKHAEFKATAFFRQITERGRDRWVPGTGQGGVCRVRGEFSPVIHDHACVNNCTNM